jgi:Alw26I/Eco31I/Esp3I family type II restriction m6 adenine DNA methyltransferase
LGALTTFYLDKYELYGIFTTTKEDLLLGLFGKLFSKQYYEYVDGFVSSKFETVKILGQFYTNTNVAIKMISEVLDNFDFSIYKSDIKIIDPFCGDGRLIVLLIEMLAERKIEDKILDITIWDVDEKNIWLSEENINKAAQKNRLNIKLSAEIVDTYVAYSEFIEVFDICITNPPWGILKPQKILNGEHSVDEIEKYKATILAYDSYMKNEFCISQPTSKFGKWGTNLSRCGVEVALRLIKRQGFCGFVSPASLLSDQVSQPLREWIFEKYHVLKINYYPAEAKLYGSADTSSVTAVVKKDINAKEIKFDVFDKELNFVSHFIEKSEYDFICDKGYIFPFEIGIDMIPILEKFENMQQLDIYCEKWGLKFVREIDETRIQEKLQDSGDVVFIKGYMVDRYQYEISPLQYINPLNARIPGSVNYNKIVWRDVARNSSKRRIKATIIPSGFMAGNSLGIAYVDPENSDKLKTILVIMNSFVFELQVRALLVTNHVSAGIVKKIKIPNLDELGSRLSDMYNSFENQNSVTEEDLECMVAQAYNLSLEEFSKVLTAFKLTSKEKKAIQSCAIKYLK